MSVADTETTSSSGVQANYSHLSLTHSVLDNEDLVDFDEDGELDNQEQTTSVQGRAERVQSPDHSGTPEIYRTALDDEGVVSRAERSTEPDDVLRESSPLTRTLVTAASTRSSALGSFPLDGPCPILRSAQLADQLSTIESMEKRLAVLKAAAEADQRALSAKSQELTANSTGLGHCQAPSPRRPVDEPRPQRALSLWERIGPTESRQHSHVPPGRGEIPVMQSKINRAALELQKAWAKNIRGPDRFNGSPRSHCRTWVRAMNNHVAEFERNFGARLADHQIIAMAGSLLKGTAQQWYTTRTHDNNPNLKWSEFSADLIAAFGETAPRSRAFTELIHLELRRDIRQFHAKFITLMIKAQLPDTLAKEIFLKAMPTEVSSALAAVDPDTESFSMFATRAIRTYDQAFRLEDRGRVLGKRREAPSKPQSEDSTVNRSQSSFGSKRFKRGG